MATTITDSMSGQQCSFRSKNPGDTQIWEGTIVGIKLPMVAAQAYRVIPPYNNAVRQADSSVSSDPSQLTYFLLQVDNNTDGASLPITAFAEEWIEDGSFTLTTGDTPVNITVYNAPGASPQAIIDYLWQGGYRAYLNTTTTS